jgi:hypothetical protein
MRKFIFVFVSFIFLTCYPLYSIPCFPECPSCSTECDPALMNDCDSPTCQSCLSANCPSLIPIDGGLIWLILGGAGLGAGRIIKNKKKSKL